jgi:hypothetical protein
MAIAALVFLLVPLLVLGALQWWSVWLVRRGAAPQWTMWGVAAILVIVVLGTAAGYWDAAQSIGGAASADQKQAMLSASISEAVNTGALFCVPLPLAWLGVLVFFTIRGRKPPDAR